MNVPVITVDLKSQVCIWKPALSGHVDSGRKLLNAFTTEVKNIASDIFGGKALLPLLKFSADHLNERLGAHFREEIEELADLLKAKPADVILANLAYDLANTVGCSTFVQPLPTGGTLHARNLDWNFPGDLLKKHVTIAHVCNGGKQPYYKTVMWPGLFGVLTGVAEDRFAITVNYVRHSKQSTWWSLPRRVSRGYWPVTWLVRKIFDEETNYQSARKLLEKTPILAPVLFAISGPEAKDGAIIERDATDYQTRDFRDGSVCVTNHYISRRFAEFDAGGNMLCSDRRLLFLEHQLKGNSILTPADAFQLLSQFILLNDETQYQVAMSAHGGLLQVRVP